MCGFMGVNRVGEGRSHPTFYKRNIIAPLNIHGKFAFKMIFQMQDCAERMNVLHVYLQNAVDFTYKKTKYGSSQSTLPLFPMNVLSQR